MYLVMHTDLLAAEDSILKSRHCDLVFNHSVSLFLLGFRGVAIYIYIYIRLSPSRLRSLSLSLSASLSHLPEAKS